MTNTQTALSKATHTTSSNTQAPHDWTAPHITEGTIYTSSWG